jgi:lipopolysaccharide export LptBFGC system permease protein LptF
MERISRILKPTALLILLLTTVSMIAGNPVFKKLPDKSFSVSSKSRTVEISKGETYSLKMTLKKDRYYFISIVGEKQKGCLQYKIIDPQKNNSVIFDNSAYEFNKDMTFFNENEREVIIEIRTLPCVFKKKSLKENHIKLLFANKKSKNHEEFNLDSNFNMYAVN